MLLLYVHVKVYQVILTLRCRSLAFTSYKTLLKIKKKSGTGLLASFSVWFLMKNSYVLLIDQISLPDCLYFLICWAICVILYFPDRDEITKFEINLNFPTSSFNKWTKKSGQNLNIFRTKKLFRWNKNHFSSLLKSFSLKQRKWKFFEKRESRSNIM